MVDVSARLAGDRAPDADVYPLELLDADERARLAATRTHRAAHVYAAAHVLLRVTLGRYLDADPATVRYARRPCAGCGGPHGKPVLADGAAHFSLSHSATIALVAVGPYPLGVDVEQVRPGRDRDGLIGRLHPREQAKLLDAGIERREDAFVDCWTRKEAYLKATGDGLTAPLSSVYTGHTGEPDAVPGAIITPLTVASGYRAALAVIAPR